jgi:acetyltransferase
MRSRLGDDMTAAYVQPMIPGGIEVMLGATDDPTFGHVLAFGAGGTLVELLADIAFRIHPLPPTDADDIIQQTRVAKLLTGSPWRRSERCPGAPRSDPRLSALINICPEIRELDINPLKVLQHGAIALDARIRVERIVPAPPSRRIAY